MDPPWLRSLTSKTITMLGPCKKFTLDACFSDTEIPHDHMWQCGPTLVTIFYLKDQNKVGSWEKVHFGRTF